MSEPTLPPQHQEQQPGRQSEMHPQPQSDSGQPGCNRLRGKAILITGGDSGIGRAIAVAAAKEGANVAITHTAFEQDDAAETARLVTGKGVECVKFEADLDRVEDCRRVVERTIEHFGRLDILVNDAGEQHPQDKPEAITPEQLEKTFRTNVFAQFHTVNAALPHLKSGAAIVSIASVTAYEGNPRLVDYSSTKGALVSFVRALSNAIVDRGIRVNAVAPGPIWTPLIPATFKPEQVEKFGADTPMKRPGQPFEVAAAVIFLASDDASYISGQTVHVNGGTVVNG
jgi:NAD(P)-dependent dehydrogenase (short-subunit alcohol dehydrogenase family)